MVVGYASEVTAVRPAVIPKCQGGIRSAYTRLLQDTDDTLLTGEGWIGTAGTREREQRVLAAYCRSLC